MTCEEARKILEGSPLEVTRAERASVLKHWRDCSECSKWVIELEKSRRAALERELKKAGKSAQEVELFNQALDTIAGLGTLRQSIMDHSDPEYIKIRYSL